MVVPPTCRAGDAVLVALRALPGADQYLRAQEAVCRRSDPRAALRRAADAGHPAAVSDLAVLGGATPPPTVTAACRWVRQHLQIVAAALTDPALAEALLRDHASEFGCDPLALFVVAGGLAGIHGDGFRDLRSGSCSC